MFDETNEIIFLGSIIILMLFLVLIAIVNIATSDDYAETAGYIESADLTNGDIVCVAYQNISGKFVSSFSNSIWSHTGIIWIDPKTNIKYVVEGSVYGCKKYRQFVRVPFETWLYFNRKSIIGYKRYIGPELNSYDMEEVFLPYEKLCQLEGANIFWSRFLIKRDYYEYQINQKYTCIEYTIMILQKLGVYKKDKIYSSYLPCDIVNDMIPTNHGIKYEKVKQIKLQPVDLLLLKEDIEKNKKFWQN